MLKKIVVIALLVFFAAGTFTVMAGEKAAGKDENALQSMYNWFSGWDKASECCCKTCGKQCCKNCNADCGGKCCSECGKK